MPAARGAGALISRYLPEALAAVFAVFWLYWAFDPYDRRLWVAENLPVVIAFALLVATQHRFRFSNTAYALMAGWLFWHTVGGHYGFQRVPFGAVTELFDFERNHFDRVGHILIGLWAYPIAELMRRNGWIPGAVPAMLFALFAIFAIAASYEISEWWFAVASHDLQGGVLLGSLMLGAQGDVWDAQRDMLADALGALAALAVYCADGSLRSPGTRSAR